MVSRSYYIQLRTDGHAQYGGSGDASDAPPASAVDGVFQTGDEDDDLEIDVASVTGAPAASAAPEKTEKVSKD